MWAQAGTSTDNSTIIILLPASERSWNQQLNSTEKVFIVNKFHKCKWANEKLLCFTLWCSASMCCSASSVFNRPHASGAFVLSGVLQLLLRQKKKKTASCQRFERASFIVTDHHAPEVDRCPWTAWKIYHFLFIWTWKGGKKYFILYLSYRLSFLLRISTQKLPFIATFLAC